jgi:hypothetical protein
VASAVHSSLAVSPQGMDSMVMIPRPGQPPADRNHQITIRI